MLPLTLAAPIQITPPAAPVVKRCPGDWYVTWKQYEFKLRREAYHRGERDWRGFPKYNADGTHYQPSADELEAWRARMRAEWPDWVSERTRAEIIRRQRASDRQRASE